MAELPLVLAVHALPDVGLEREMLAGVARVERVGLAAADLSSGLLQQAKVVLTASLADLPRSVRKRLRCVSLVLCLGDYGDEKSDAVAAAEIAPDVHVARIRVRTVDERADTVIALMLALLRRTTTLAMHGSVSHAWVPTPSLLQGTRRCRGLTLGLVGADAVACAVARRARALEMNVCYWDPYVVDDSDQSRASSALDGIPGIQRCTSFLGLVSRTDVLSLHCPGTPETRRLVNNASLAIIKAGALLINIGSPDIVDASALKQALADGLLGGAALDSVDGPDWIESWIRELPNLLVTPKTAAFSEQAWSEVRFRAASAVRVFLKHKDSHAGFAAIQDDIQPPTTAAEETHVVLTRELNSATQSAGESSTSGRNTVLTTGSRNANGQHADAGWSFIDFSKTMEYDSGGRAEALKPGMLVALRAFAPGHPNRDQLYYVAKYRADMGRWVLDVSDGVSRWDPAAQFKLLHIQDRYGEFWGVRSTAGHGLCLQGTRQGEMLFASHKFDAWERWRLQGSNLECLQLTNFKFPTVHLIASFEILALSVDGIVKWCRPKSAVL
eukprot:jgi/Chlat1/4398/Chrsp29S04531